MAAAALIAGMAPVLITPALAAFAGEGANLAAADALEAVVSGDGGAASGAGDEELEIYDVDVPLAGWSLMSLDHTEGIVCYDEDDAAIFVTFSFVIGDKVYFFGDPHIDYYLQPNPKQFGDIAGHWAVNNIEFIAEREAYLGFPDGSFRPNAQVTRAMFATVLSRLVLEDLSGYDDRAFDDVDPGSWYGPAVAWAYENGVVEGIGEGLFNPDGNVTRQDMLLMVARFIDAFEIELVAGDDEISFADEDLIGAWAADSVARMCGYNIVTGRPGNMFDPRGFSTRAEVAAVLCRLVESAITNAYDRLDGNL